MFNEIIHWKRIYNNIKKISDNIYKQLRYKLINNITLNAENSFMRKINDMPYWNACHVTDDLTIFSCKKRKTFGIEQLKHLNLLDLTSNLVIGYNN